MGQGESGGCCGFTWTTLKLNRLISATNALLRVSGLSAGSDGRLPSSPIDCLIKNSIHGSAFNNPVVERVFFNSATRFFQVEI